MDLKHFRLIKTIAEEGSIANSSERLFLTQSALSHQLRELEERLGFKVFNRSRNRWQLTQEGEELHKLANQLLSTLEEGFSNIRQIKEGSRGTIKVCAECHSFLHGIPAFVQKMAVLYPEIKIDIDLGATSGTISKVLSDEVDVAIVTTKPSSDMLTSIEVFNDELFAVVHIENPLSEYDYLDASHFAETHLLINSFPLESVSVYELFLKPNKITPIKISAIPFTEVSLEMVNANMGIMCLPKWTLKSFKIPDDLVFKKIGKFGLKRTHYLVMKEEHKSQKHISDFISNFVEEFSEY